MEIGFTPIATSLACIFTIMLLWEAFNWVWLRPKRLEKFLREKGFKGNSYRFLFGDKKGTSEMIKVLTSKPMEHFSNDYVPRILPFFHQTINNYGEKSFIWNGPTPEINITKPELIREVLMKLHDFHKPLPNPILKKLSKGLLRLEGEAWAQERKLINPAFHFERLKHMLPAFSASCQEMIDEWEKLLSTNESKEVEVEMWSYVHNMSADAISRAAFGSSFGEGRRVFELIREQAAITTSALQSIYIPGWRYLPTRANRRMDEINKEIRALLTNLIERRRKAMQDGEACGEDLLDVLLKSSFQGVHCQHERHGNNKQQKITLSFDEVIEECKLFYLAGQDVMAAFLAWTLILLSKNQGWQEQLREEIWCKFGNNKPDFEGLNQLKKVEMVLHEVLRLYPPGPLLSRKVCHDITVQDIQLPAGVIVNMPIVYVHHSESIWGAEAKEFKPERFSNGISKATGGNMSFFAFGWGPRICIASNFSMLEAKMALSLILQRFSLHLSPAYAHAPTMGRGTMRPQFGAKLIVRRL